MKSEFTVGEQRYETMPEEHNVRGFWDCYHIIGIYKMDWSMFEHLFRFPIHYRNEMFFVADYHAAAIELVETMFPKKIFDFDSYYFIDRDLEYVVLIAPINLDKMIELEEK